MSHHKNAVVRHSKDEPQILMGASSSNKIGWFMKISRAFVQRYLISYSCSCTGLPGRLPRTVIKKRKKTDAHQYCCSKTRARSGMRMRRDCSRDASSTQKDFFHRPMPTHHDTAACCAADPTTADALHPPPKPPSRPPGEDGTLGVCITSTSLHATPERRPSHRHTPPTF